MSEVSRPSPPVPPVSFRSHVSSREFRHIGAALRQKEFRYFLAGSFLSNIGSWMQSVAQAWLVLQMTNSPFYLGLDGFANTIPISIFAFWGGVVADRFDRRRLLIATQWVMLGLALLLGVLTQFKLVHVWQVIVFSFFTGLIQSIAWPVYQTMMGNIVPRERISNAIALNSTQFNLARLIGPLVGAFGLSFFGTAGCFYVNAVSFLAVILALTRIHVRVLPRPFGASHSSLRQSFREGFTYMRAERSLFWVLLLVAVSSILGTPLITLLPVFARDILKIGASGLGVLVGAFGAGAVLGGISMAFLGNFSHKGSVVMGSTFMFVIGMLGFSLTRYFPLSLGCLAVAGFSMVGIGAVVNTYIQQSAPEHLRGRAISLFVFCFGGVMPLGNLLAGYLAHIMGAPAALLAQGIGLGSFALYVYFWHPEVRSMG